jgi:predicted DNA-binding protein
MTHGNILKFRIPSDLHSRLEATAARSARTRSDVTREAIVIGLAALAMRIPAEDNSPPQAA